MKRLFGLLFFIACSATFAEQKVVLISGSSGGIGSAIVQAFEADGWKVWAGCRKPSLADTENVRQVALDITDEQSIQQAVQTVLTNEGQIDALINSAGYGIIGAEECVKIDEMKKLFEVNFFGSVRMMQAVLPHMRAKKSGRIINISSASGVRALPCMGSHAASKFALEGYCEALATTVSPWNIHVSLVQPGGVKTNWAKKAIIQTSPAYATMTTAFHKRLSSLLENGQEPSEIAEQIVTIANTATPNLRYQTTDAVKKTLSKKLCDLTGNTMRAHQNAFLNSFMND